MSEITEVRAGVSNLAEHAAQESPRLPDAEENEYLLV